MGPTSPQAALGTSPQFNHFAPLSPDAVNTSLDGDPEMNAILGLAPMGAKPVHQPTAPPSSLPQLGGAASLPPRPPGLGGPLKVYTRSELLRLSTHAQPPSMPPFEDWFGTPHHHHNRVDDPAIASIGHGGGRRGGGAGSFGEGFGFGGGIGTRVLGRGGSRNIGLRRQQDHANVDPAIAEQSKGTFGGPMGKFSMRATSERGMRLGGDESRHRDGGERERGDRSDRDRDRRRRDDGGDWRRGDRQPAGGSHHGRNGDSTRRGPPGLGGPRYDDDSIEPAWMTDEPTTGAMDDPAIAGASSSGDPSDPLIKFVPGEDMIAAHKRAMKARAGGGGADGGSWRAPADKPLVSFFGAGGEQQTQAAAPAKPKEVNVQSYFKHRVFDEEDDDKPTEKEEEEQTSQFQSRFQRFFGSTSGPPQQAQSQHSAPSATSPVPPMSAGAPPSSSSLSSSHQQQQSQQQQQYPERPTSVTRAPEPQGASPAPQSVPGTDNHMAKLMGLLSTKNPSPAPRPTSTDMGQQQRPMSGGAPPPHQFHGSFQGPPPGMSPYAQSPVDSPNDYMGRQSRPDHSPERGEMPPGPPPHMRGGPPGGHHYSSPPPGADPRGFGYGGPMPSGMGGPGGPYGRPPMGELPTHGRPPFFDQRMGPPPPGGPGAPPDLLQLLQAGRGPPPPMGMLPPHPSMYSGPPGGGSGPSPDDLLRSLQGGPGPGATSPGAPQGYLPMGGRPPLGGHAGHGGPGGPGGPGYGPPPPMQGYLPPQFFGGPGGPGGSGGPPPPGLGPGGPHGPPRPPGMYSPSNNQDMLAALLSPHPQH